jgi:hypothetical protein
VSVVTGVPLVFVVGVVQDKVAVPLGAAALTVTVTL